MKKVDLAMIPVEQALLVEMKRNIKAMDAHISIGNYIKYITAMHANVLRLKAERANTEEKT